MRTLDPSTHHPTNPRYHGGESHLTTTQPNHEAPREGFDIAAGLLAVVFPGLGHFVFRERWRGITAMIGVMGLFLSGLLVGGIDCVDKREDRIWFIGQALVGPAAFATNWYHQNMLKVHDGNTFRTAWPHEIRDPKTHRPIQVRHETTGQPMEFVDPKTGQTRLGTDKDMPPNTKSISRINEIGTLMATLAGMLNLIVILDALFPTLHPEKGAAS
ncbi:MAG: hypothetical protein H6815_06300 [Phycisphaeraceae bacterium]|nr:hypothetical protein [Phycisphaerales bacterium]MCB9860050.1 hypothetical protein [Phycisphaeraceae bacterium]